jgi:hypothetical protein
MSPLTWNLDLPMPYTADRFYLDGERLQVVHPPFLSFEEYVQAIYDPVKWREFLDVLAKKTPCMTPLSCVLGFLIIRHCFVFFAARMGSASSEQHEGKLSIKAASDPIASKLELLERSFTSLRHRRGVMACSPWYFLVTIWAIPTTFFRRLVQF